MVPDPEKKIISRRLAHALEKRGENLEETRKNYEKSQAAESKHGHEEEDSDDSCCVVQ